MGKKNPTETQDIHNWLNIASVIKRRWAAQAAGMGKQTLIMGRDLSV
jgi:ribosomal 50S subunit-recycling heat shock protein